MSTTETKVRHTAGPWKLSETASRCIIGNSAHGGRMSVCVMQNTQSEHYQANCNVVTAAPDMLHALMEAQRRFVQALEPTTNEQLLFDLKTGLAAVDGAIAKAKGGAA